MDVPSSGPGVTSPLAGVSVASTLGVANIGILLGSL